MLDDVVRVQVTFDSRSHTLVEDRGLVTACWFVTGGEVVAREGQA